jgi:integrase/recombinase XerC
MPALPERLPKPLDEPARDRLLEALPADTLAQKRDRAFIVFPLSTGARISEALRLDRHDWTSGRMHLVGKGNRERVVFVTDKAAQAVEDYLAARTDTHRPCSSAFTRAQEQPRQPAAGLRRRTPLPAARATAGHHHVPPPPAAAPLLAPGCRKPWATPG